MSVNMACINRDMFAYESKSARSLK